MSAIPEPSRRRLAILTAGALGAATLIFLAVVLPAEYGRDPLGFGRLTGLTRLASHGAAPAPDAASAPKTAAVPGGAGSTAHLYPAAYRTDSLEIPLEFADELEYKVRMKRGDTLVYSWTVEGARTREDLYADFHGEVPHSEPEQVEEYRQATEGAAHGALVAGFDGVHGWYFQNRGEEKLVVRLKISGYYELVPAGETGNERGIVPRS